jgi:hypothetical protein
MPFGHGKAGAVLVNGFDLSAYLNSAEISAEISTHDSTVFGQNSQSHQTGITSGGLQLGGFFERTDSSGSHAVLSAALGAAAARVAACAPEGFTAGYPCVLIGANETKYDDSVKIESLVSVAAYLKATGGVDANGVSLRALAAATATANDASVDNAASSSNGGVGHLHVTAASGTTPTITVKIQHSANNSTWADLVTFTQASAATGERIVVAAGTTVNRYLRAIYTIGGTDPSFTFTVAFARR